MFKKYKFEGIPDYKLTEVGVEGILASVSGS